MKNLFSLEKQRVLITGAAGGIGSAKVSASLGAETILVDKVSTEPLVQELRSNGSVASGYSCDVRDRAAVEDICRQIGAIDAAVLNAGANPYNDWNAADWNDSFRDIMAINVLDPINFSRAIIPNMQTNGHGRIVLTGSIAAFNGGFLGSTPPQYAISKAAIHTLTRWLAKRAGEDIQVNVVAPGVVDTRSGLENGVSGKLPWRAAARWGILPKTRLHGQFEGTR